MGRGIPAPRSCLLRAGTRGYLRTGDLPAKQSALTCLLRALFSIYTKHLALQQSCSNTPAADGFPKANTALGFGQRGGRRETRGKQRGTEASKQAHSIPCPYRSAMSSAQPKHHREQTRHSHVHGRTAPPARTPCPRHSTLRTLAGRTQAVPGLGTLCRSSPATAPMCKGFLHPISDQLCPEGNEAARSKSSLMFYPKGRAAPSFSFLFVCFCAAFFFLLLLFFSFVFCFNTYGAGEGAGGNRIPGPARITALLCSPCQQLPHPMATQALHARSPRRGPAPSLSPEHGMRPGETRSFPGHQHP